MDALSDDQRYGITLIAFVGSVFSPYYAWARRRGSSDPMAHCALNVALYGGLRRWAMTERGSGACQRDRDCFQIGPSLVRCSDQGLHWQINELANPLPRPLIGEVSVAMGKGWRPDVFFDRPRLSWQGWAYVDANEGDEPIEQGFSDWDWSRAHLPDHSTAVLYDVRSTRSKVQAPTVLALRFADGQAPQAFAPGKRQSLGKSLWGIERHSFHDDKQTARLHKNLEDTPFYNRSVIRSSVLGHEVLAMHETLDARRFARPWVQSLLPWRMPRVA
ncbi:MAG: carotenoid 1,2-hydratase [Betaproteobacteria bacterium]|nr:carotenoid 1,2-hydratase [Betaproteobacteria bacterium]